MARIQNIDPKASSLGHNGKEYPAKDDGVFDVPDQLAAELVRFPHWRIYDGQPWPHEKTPEELEGERIAAIVRKAVEDAPLETKKKRARK